MNPNITAHLALFAVAIIYAANYSIAKFVMDPGIIGPNGFVLCRIIFTAILSVGFFRISKKIDRADWPLLIICTITGVVFNQLLFFNGLKISTPIHASLIMICTPLFVSIWSTVSGAKLTSLQWMGCVLGGIGAAWLIVSQTAGQWLSSIGWGDILVGINAISFAYYIVKVPTLLQKYGWQTIMIFTFGSGSILCLPFGLKEALEISFQTFSMEMWFSFTYVLFFTTFIAYTLNVYALHNVSGQLVSQYIYLQPLFAAFFAICLGKDHLELEHLISAGLIFTGLWMVNKKKKLFSSK